MTRPDALALANRLDAEWHKQPRSFEREALTRFWGLLTLPARALDPNAPRRMLQAATVLRNARFTGATVKDMFFADKHYTEVDGIFLRVGSSLGHRGGDEAWVVEVERKSAHNQGDYYLAIHRARRFVELFEQRLGVRARPVVIYEDEGGKLTYKQFDGDVLLITMSALRDRTRGLSFRSWQEIPGAACDKTLVKLALLRQLVTSDPNLPGSHGSPLAMATRARLDGFPVGLPVFGHQDADELPGTVREWLALGEETDSQLAKRMAKYLDELHESGTLISPYPEPRLSYEGGQLVLEAMRVEAEDPA